MGAATRFPIIDYLPPPNTKRWIIHRKAAVVEAVRGGIISLDEACRIYNISAEEFQNWQRLVDAHGIVGLRVTQAQKYRVPKPTG
jgi:hypothetical protein